MGRSRMVGWAASVALGAWLASETGSAAPPPADPEMLRLLTGLGGVLALVDDHAVRPADHQREVEGSVEGLLTSIDPHSGYIPAKTYTTMTARGAPQPPGGIGLSLVTDSGIARMVTPIEGGPAARADTGLAPPEVRFPPYDAVAKFYPVRARRLGIEGRVTFRCTITLDGAPRDCTILSEAPADLGFGEATLKAVQLFQIRQWSRDGAPVSGGVFTQTMQWRLPR